ncbi:four helix bundle protein [Vibrio antiquarius]|uniref:four helix bundle protein n=1 Tax=Vibrio antiquarius (strain Ex25) TaxID=150340 RepID=UPI0034A002B5
MDLKHSALSVPSNIAEGLQRETAKEERFLYYAKGAVGELLRQTYIGIEIGYIDLRPSQHGKYNDQIRTNPTRTS